MLWEDRNRAREHRNRARERDEGPWERDEGPRKRDNRPFGHENRVFGQENRALGQDRGEFWHDQRPSGRPHPGPPSSASPHPILHSNSAFSAFSAPSELASLPIFVTFAPSRSPPLPPRRPPPEPRRRQLVLTVPRFLSSSPASGPRKPGTWTGCTPAGTRHKRSAPPPAPGPLVIYWGGGGGEWGEWGGEDESA
jgi:hypothetical protein